MKCYGGRALLNLEGHHSTSAIVAEVENTAHWDPGKARDRSFIDRWNIEPFCVLQISDCDRRACGWKSTSRPRTSERTRLTRSIQ